MEIIDAIKDLLQNRILNSGAAFYSSSATLRKGKFLIIGLNPGGDPEIIKETIKDSFVTFQDPLYNAYFEKWKNNGELTRLQKNLQDLFSYLNVDLKTVCATNIFYERSKTEKGIPLTSLPIYKSILEKVISVVEPDIILTFGKMPFRILTELVKPETEIEIIPSGHGNWKILRCIARLQNRKIKVVGLPHLSIYTLYNRPKQLVILKDFISNP